MSLTTTMVEAEQLGDALNRLVGEIKLSTNDSRNMGSHQVLLRVCHVKRRSSFNSGCYSEIDGQAIPAHPRLMDGRDFNGLYSVRQFVQGDAELQIRFVPEIVHILVDGKDSRRYRYERVL